MAKHRVTHRVFMPPKMQPVPKGPVLPNFCSKPTRRIRPYAKVCMGGPWDGKSIQVALDYNEATMVLKVGSWRGRYWKRLGEEELMWERVDV